MRRQALTDRSALRERIHSSELNYILLLNPLAVIQVFLKLLPGILTRGLFRGEVHRSCSRRATTGTPILFE